MVTMERLDKEMNALSIPVILTNKSDEAIAANEKASLLFPGKKIKNFSGFLDIESSGTYTFSTESNSYYVYKESHAWEEGCHFYFFLRDQNKNKNEEIKRVLSSVLENSYDAIYITDAEGNTIQTNDAIERITGIPKEYYIGKNVDQLVKRGILHESLTQRVVEQRKPVTIFQRGFDNREIMNTGSPVFNEQGAVEKVVTNVRDLTELKRLRDEVEKVRKLNSFYKSQLEKAQTSPHTTDFVCRNEQMKQIFQTGERMADVDATVLVLGETGVGKDVFAKHVHAHSKRAQHGEFVKIDCGAIPPTLLESELFGYEAGAFSGANASGKAGMFELADKGILFLDEVGEMPLDLQVKLLRVLQEGEIRRVGSTKTKKIDVRIIAATNRNLKRMVSDGEFREDLYYRLNVIPIYIPPLRERREEIPAFIDFNLQKYNKKYNVNKEFTENLLRYFTRFDWPGNVRELANLVERLVVTIPHNIVDVIDLPADLQDDLTEKESGREFTTLQEAAEKSEEELLARALERYRNTYKIAEVLGTSQATVVRKLKKYGLTT